MRGLGVERHINSRIIVLVNWVIGRFGEKTGT
jgi:hypothetical protein